MAKETINKTKRRPTEWRRYLQFFCKSKTFKIKSLYQKKISTGRAALGEELSHKACHFSTFPFFGFTVGWFVCLVVWDSCGSMVIAQDQVLHLEIYYNLCAFLNS